MVSAHEDRDERGRDADQNRFRERPVPKRKQERHAQMSKKNLAKDCVDRPDRPINSESPV
jgi:hypothetical protein